MKGAVCLILAYVSISGLISNNQERQKFGTIIEQVEAIIVPVSVGE